MRSIDQDSASNISREIEWMSTIKQDTRRVRGLLWDLGLWSTLTNFHQNRPRLAYGCLGQEFCGRENGCQLQIKILVALRQNSNIYRQDLSLRWSGETTQADASQTTNPAATFPGARSRDDLRSNLIDFLSNHRAFIESCDEATKIQKAVSRKWLAIFVIPFPSLLLFGHVDQIADWDNKGKVPSLVKR